MGRRSREDSNSRSGRRSATMSQASPRGSRRSSVSQAWSTVPENGSLQLETASPLTTAALSISIPQQLNPYASPLLSATPPPYKSFSGRSQVSSPDFLATSFTPSGLMSPPSTPKKSDRLRQKQIPGLSSLSEAAPAVAIRALQFPLLSPSAQTRLAEDEASRDSGFESDLSASGSTVPTPNGSDSDEISDGTLPTPPASHDTITGDRPEFPARCQWTNCKRPRLNPQEDICYHLFQEHVLPQRNALSDPTASHLSGSRASGRRERLKGEAKKRKMTFACRWVGCRVFERPPTRGDNEQKYEWLSSHVRERHGGPRPYSCIIDGCCLRFASKSGLHTHLSAGHLASRKEERSSRSESASAGDSAKTTGSGETHKILTPHLQQREEIQRKKLKRRKIFLSKTPDPSEDFIDEATIEILQERLAHSAIGNSDETSYCTAKIRHYSHSGIRHNSHLSLPALQPLLKKKKHR